jgi:hypothetical protein
MGLRRRRNLPPGLPTAASPWSKGRSSSTASTPGEGGEGTPHRTLPVGDALLRLVMNQTLAGGAPTSLA